MAKQKSNQNSASSLNTSDTKTFMKGMSKDATHNFITDEVWTHARNAVNNSASGDLGVLGNEPANLECAKISYTIIGAIHKYGDQWIIFSTDDVSSEIGLFDDSKCEYTTILNAPCLNFNRKHLITGAAKENYDCSWQVYWDDGNNPSRTLNLDNIPYVKIEQSAPGAECPSYIELGELDCERLRLAPLLSTPCVTLTKGINGGSLRNGSYQAFIAYTIDGVRVTDYIGISNVQSIFDHLDTSGSLDITFSDLDTNFSEFELVILTQTSQSAEARKIGNYSTEINSINIDAIRPTLDLVVPIQNLPLRRPAFDKSDAMFVVNDWLIRKGPTEKFDFNYQPLANNIRVKWVVAEYPAEYYFKGGSKTSFMRDEQYAFFIRWIYNTGERSASYHIPGRAPKTSGVNQFGQIVNETGINIGPNAIDTGEYNFKVYNTAYLTQQGLSTPTGDGGTIISKGEMAYWQSTERYPTTDNFRWGNLCGKNIRHHKMPTEEVHDSLRLYNPDNDTIRLLGVEFENIQPPLDNDGNVITSIVGYELLRGSRLGNKSILAKGILRNMRVYDILQGSSNNEVEKGLYPNYPYNSLAPDVYFHKGNPQSTLINENRTDGCNTFTESVRNYPPLTEYKKDFFTFHSPELMFERPFLNAYNLRIYGELSGESVGHFIPSEDHPKAKLLRNIGAYLAGIVGIGYAMRQIRGTYKEVKIPGKFKTQSSTQRFGTSNAIGLDLAGWAGSAILGAVTGGSGFFIRILRRLGVGTAPSDNTNPLEQSYPDLSALFVANTVWRNNIRLKASLARLLPAISFGSGTEGGGLQEESTKDTALSNLPPVIAAAAGIALAQMNVSIGAKEIIDLLYNLVSEEDFAYKFNSHGYYNKFLKRRIDQVYRTKILNSTYLGSSFQQFQDYKVNNLFRPGTVAIATHNEIEDPITEDRSRYVVGGRVRKNGAIEDFGDIYIKDPEANQSTTISAHYGALKFNFDNQYGQIRSISQIPMRGCVEKVNVQHPQQRFTSQPIFAGDTYINRYTEKVIMPIFSDFLKGQPDLYPYDYLQRINIPYPRYWMDTREFDTGGLGRELLRFGFQTGNTEVLPNDNFYLDRGASSCIRRVFNRIMGGGGDPNPWFAMRHAYMYTHVNGILDFYVESEKNMALRDWEDEDRLRHYDPYHGYQDTDILFHSDIIKFGNFYKYDESLSIARLITQLQTQGNIQNAEYNPEVSETCLQHYPKRLIYSLQQGVESNKKEIINDNWRVFLPNNYKDFYSPVTTIKPINDNGAIIFFPYQSPKLFQGTDTLNTNLGTKLTIGDGGLFSAPMKNITNSDFSHEYGSVENMRCIINTPYGLFFMSQAQGKVFQFQSSLTPISDIGMKHWFNKYLPSQLIRQVPELEFSKLSDNPVIGIGCQAVYDITNEIVYFSKKDYRIKDAYINNIRFEDDKFYYSISKLGGYEIQLGDPMYFEDASWVISFDPKIKAWISFHDWTPELTMSSIRTFLTTKTSTVNVPACPPGYNFNAVTGKCEGIKQVSQQASVSIDNIPVTENDGQCDCPPGYTIVYLDSTGHFASPFGNCVEIIPGSAGGDECYTVEACDGTIVYVPKSENLSIGDWVLWQPFGDPVRLCGRIIDDSYITLQYTGVLYQDSTYRHSSISNGCSTIIFPSGGTEPENLCGSVGILMDVPDPPDQGEPDVENLTAICRKIECLCPQSPFAGGVTTETGNCDDIYAVGDPNYVNQLPRMCHYFFADEVVPSYAEGSIWKHNDRCDLFVNYYGVDYPWEVEAIHTTQVLVTSLRSVEYQLESYVYKNLPNGECGEDRWHDLDFNFDEAIIHNTEQISGLLKLELNPKEDPYATLDYPIFGINDIRILYSKEEQKFRFNQFFDLTRDRGEFTGIQNFKFNTQPNGYVRDLNPSNLDYQKDPFQLKKFRHYANKLVLRRTVSGNRKMLFKISNVKLNYSPR